MALTEIDAARLIRRCVGECSREVSLGEFNDWLESNYSFDDDDLQVSPSRPNEFKYRQVIRNLKSHNSRVEGVPICEVGFGSYLRWLDSGGYVFGNLDVGTQSSDIDGWLASMHDSAIDWYLNRQVACLGGRRLDWVRKARRVGGDVVDLVIPNTGDKGRTSTFCRVLSTTRKCRGQRSMDVCFPISDGLLELCRLSEGFDTVFVVVVCDPMANAVSFKGCREFTADMVLAGTNGGVLWT